MSVVADRCDMHHWARCYVARGWHVLPVVPGGKDPARGKGNTSDASTNPDDILRWWGPDAADGERCFNIGIELGRSGLLVVDVDFPKTDDGMADYSLSAGCAFLEARIGPLPRDVVVRSQSGGFHIYFRDPGCHCAVWLPGARMIDILRVSDPLRGVHVVAPPSVVNGRRYTWSRCEPEVPDLPEPWLQLMRAPGPIGWYTLD